MRTLKIDPSDNVAVVTEEGAVIPMGHKVALRDIPEGGEVIKYGSPIGRATTDIPAGGHVHTHNMKSNLAGEMEYAYRPVKLPEGGAPRRRSSDTFKGFRRPGGKVGIRNELWIIPTVGCVNSIGNIIANKAGGLARGSISGVYSFSHPYGCSQLGEDHENTRKALRGLIAHPNAGGVLVLGLGCENNTVAGMKELLGHGDTERVKFLTCQDYGDEVAAALAMLEELASYAGKFEREDVPMAELIVGLKCGGSDGLSGITANPLVGMFSDMLTDAGGSTILTEVPEMFGAETILFNRCVNDEVFNKAVKMVNGFKKYYLDHGQPVYENPSPGNKAGGISSLEDKSLGCTQKAGRAAVTDVLDYGEPLTEQGLNLLNAPGNDLVASTAEAAAGAHLVLFTTGRGTPFGSPVPTVKISTNTPLADKKTEWIDFNAGGIADGEDMEAMAGKLYEYVRAAASGERLTKTEQHGIRDLAIFKNGVTL